MEADLVVASLTEPNRDEECEGIACCTDQTTTRDANVYTPNERRLRPVLGTR